jgi:hypothetical protein
MIRPVRLALGRSSRDLAIYADPAARHKAAEEGVTNWMRR